MSKITLTNAFSIQMLNGEEATVSFAPISVEEAREITKGGFLSAIGHADTASVVGDMLQQTVNCNRVSIAVTGGDVLLVAQLTGGRLPEGATTLPEGMEITFWKVLVK